VLKVHRVFTGNMDSDNFDFLFFGAKLFSANNIFELQYLPTWQDLFPAGKAVS